MFSFNSSFGRSLLLVVNCLFSCWAFAQEDIYIAPQEQIEWAKQFSGVSGPGMPVEGDGRGGWRSGTEGVVYYGNHPRPEYQEGNLRMCTGSAVEKDWYLPLSLRGNYICVMEL